MSLEHTRYVWRVEFPGSGRVVGAYVKLVMLCYADHANTDNESWPSTDRVARMTQMDPRTVERARTLLVQAGHLIPLWTGGGGRGRTNRYLVRITGSGGPETPADGRGMPTSTGSRGPETPADGRQTPADGRPNHQEPEPPRARAREAVGPPDRQGPFGAAGTPTPVAECLRLPWMTDEQWTQFQATVGITTPPAGGAPTHNASSGSERE